MIYPRRKALIWFSNIEPKFFSVLQLNSFDFLMLIITFGSGLMTLNDYFFFYLKLIKKLYIIRDSFTFNFFCIQALNIKMLHVLAKRTRSH